MKPHYKVTEYCLFCSFLTEFFFLYNKQIYADSKPFELMYSENDYLNQIKINNELWPDVLSAEI